MAADDAVSDLQVRAYFAAVIGPSRAPFGSRTSAVFPPVSGTIRLLAQNASRDRVLAVVVTRADIGAANTVVFTKSANGDASGSDFVVTIAVGNRFNFVLYPGERLSVQVINVAVAMQLSVGQETY